MKTTAKKGVKKKGKKKAKKAVAKVEEKPLPVSVTDPWRGLKSPFGGSLSPADTFNKIVAGDVGRVATMSASTVADLNDLPFVEFTHPLCGRGGAPLVTVDAPVEGLRAVGCGLSRVPVTPQSLSELVFVDVSDNSITDDAVAGVGPNFLRVLHLAANSLTRVPPLAAFPYLLHLDLSNNTLGPLSAADFTPAAATLRGLALSNCGLTTVASSGTPGVRCVLQPLTFLAVLDLSFNTLPASTLATVAASCKRLTHFDLRGNPDVTDDAPAATSKLSCLREFNGEPVNLEVAAVRSTALVDRGDAGEAAGAGDDGASCSCLEGNACVVPYACRDWPNRFKVAAAVREERRHFNP